MIYFSPSVLLPELDMLSVTSAGVLSVTVNPPESVTVSDTLSLLRALLGSAPTMNGDVLDSEIT